MRYRLLLGASTSLGPFSDLPAILLLSWAYYVSPTPTAARRACPVNAPARSPTKGRSLLVVAYVQTYIHV